MLKKFLLIMLVMFVVLSSSLICFADEESNHDHTDTTTLPEIETHTGDLYLFDNNIVMDKYVDGNVFLFGNDVEITGRINGNLFVFGNNVRFNESIVRYSIFACANSIYYNGGCGTSSDYGNLYVAASKFETTYNSYVTGDIKSVASSIILKSAVYRNVDLISNNITFGESEDICAIYGNLNYSSNTEISIPEGIMLGNGTVTYHPTYDITDKESIADIVIGFGACIVTALALFIILNKITPKFLEKVYENKFSILSLLKAFGIGLATITIFSIFIMLLVATMVGVTLAVILSLLFAILLIIAIPVLTIKITNTLKPALKLEKTSMFYLVLALVSIILYGITLIPLVGGILSLIITITAIGLIVNIFLPHKEISDEEKIAIEEKKQLAKENKDKKRQEKLEIKATKKQTKLEAKEAKKKDK